MLSSVAFIRCMRHNIFYLFLLLIKVKNFNISIDYSSLNIVFSLLPHFSQTVERTNISVKKYNILGFLIFVILIALIQ